MQVKLTTTTKRENSTYIPTFSVTLQCRLKAPSSVMNPTLMFDRENVGNNYNYAYIPEFDRYYFVTNIVYSGALVEYDLRCDVLASFKATIGASTQYVLRSASRFNGNIIDNRYPLTCEYTHDRKYVQDPYAASMTSGGVYSVGVIGSGITQYYLMTPANFKTFIEHITSDAYAAAVLSAQMIVDFPQYKAIIDGLDYISSITWLPFVPASDNFTEVTTIKVGYVSVGASAGLVTDALQPHSIYFPELLTHPLAATRGAYLNANPFTRVTLTIPIFGQFEINASDLIGWTGLNCQINYDIRTGSATLYVYVYTAGETDLNFISRISGQVGVPVQVSSVRTGGVGLPAILSTAVGIGTQTAADPLGGIVSGVQAIGDLAKNFIPNTTTIGSTGGMDGIKGNIRMDYIFYVPVDDDNTQHGRPLCELVQLSTLSGYILCESGAEVQISGTVEEQRQIISYMTGGFYYE